MILPQGETLPPAQKSLPPLTCHRCGAIDAPRLGPGKGPHFARLVSSQCGYFLRWLKKPRPLAPPDAAPASNAAQRGEVAK